jgi:predicted ester cyclase
MSVEENKATLRRTFDELLNKGNTSIIPELISTDYVHVAPLGEYKGLEGYKQWLTELRTAMPDLWAKIDEIVAEGDTVAARISLGGTFTGKLGDYEPTGKPVNISAAYFYRYKDGKEVEAVPFIDTLTLFQQLGVSPPGG